jgi:hypothetical protein
VYTPGHLALYTYVLNNPLILRDPTGAVDEPGFWEGLIPIWGSGRSAVHHFQEGNWGRGAIYTALAVSDVFLVKSLVVAGGKLVVKGGAKVLAEETVNLGEKAIADEAVTAGGKTVAKETVEQEAKVSVKAVEETAEVVKAPKPQAPPKPPIGSTGKVGENALKALGGDSQVFFRTSKGARYVDQLVNGVAHESKVGYTTLTRSVSRQIAKDVELLGSKEIQGSVWHFFKSPQTGLGGPSGPLRKALEDAGIGIVIH